MEIYKEILKQEQQFEGERQIIKIRCRDERELLETKELVIEVHALAGRLFKFFDGEYKRLDGDTEFLEDAWQILGDLWDAGFELYTEKNEV